MSRLTIHLTEIWFRYAIFGPSFKILVDFLRLLSTIIKPEWATLKAGKAEWRNDKMIERLKSSQILKTEKNLHRGWFHYQENLRNLRSFEMKSLRRAAIFFLRVPWMVLPKWARVAYFPRKDSLKINRSVKTPWLRRSMGVEGSKWWALAGVWYKLVAFW